jgi:hypothetical protein
MLGGIQKMWMIVKMATIVFFLGKFSMAKSLIFLVTCGYWCISKHELATTILGMGVIWQPRNLTRRKPSPY